MMSTLLREFTCYMDKDKLTGTDNSFTDEMFPDHRNNQKLDVDEANSTESSSLMTYRQLQVRDEAFISQILGTRDLIADAKLEEPKADLVSLKAESFTYFPDELPWKLRSPILNLYRKILRRITGRESIEILRKTSLCCTPQNYSVEGNLDWPCEKMSINTSPLIFIGWVLGKETQPIAVRLTIGKRLIVEVAIDQLRPDVSKAYCLKNSDHRLGYCALLNIKELPDRGTVLVQARYPNDSIVPLSAVTYYK